MGFLFASDKRKPIPEFTGLQIQTAVNILPIPLVYGSPRISMNLIYYNGFRSANAPSSGGKGLASGGKGGGQAQKVYYATFIGALCEGTIGSVRVVFDNQAVYPPNAAPSGKDLTVFTGTSTQTPWSVISSQWPNDAFGYKYTAYIGFNDWPLDSSATVPLLNFVVDGLFQGSCPLNLYTAPEGTQWLMDADFGEVIYDFLTNLIHGALFPTTYIDTNTIFTSPAGYIAGVGDAALSTYCQAIGFGCSVVLNNYEPAASILDRWCRNLGVAIVWTGVKLKFIPYWDAYSDLNPGYDSANAKVGLKYYKPNLTPLVNFTDNIYYRPEEGDDPIIVTRNAMYDVKNVVRVDFRDRYLLWNSNIAEAKDDSLVERFGARIERLASADEYSHKNYAGRSAQVNLQRNISVRNIYKFRLGLEWCFLEPMDLITVTDSTLGLSAQLARIRSIEEDEKGILTITAEEMNIGAANPAVYPVPTTQSSLLNPLIAPGPINPPIIFEPTTQFLTAYGYSSPVILMGISGGQSGVNDPNWGGAHIYTSTDNATYTFVSTQSKTSRMGRLTATLPAYSGTNPDTVNTLSINLSESASFVESLTPAQAALNLLICAIVDTSGDVELVGYETATLTGSYTYNLTRLYRGLYGTIPCSHPSGSGFLVLDTNAYQMPLLSSLIGSIIYFKGQSFNIFNLAAQDLSSVIAYTYTPVGNGTNVLSNPIVSALLAGVGVDLNLTTAGLDLNLGGSGPCSSILVSINLGTN